MKQVCAVVLNWNRKEETLSCLASLMGSNYKSLRIVLVDNGSSDGTEGAVRNTYPEIDVIQTNSNLGFAGGMNRGMQYALEKGADCLFLLNNDIKLEKSCITRIVEFAERNPSFGILGPLGLGYGGEPDDRVTYCLDSETLLTKAVRLSEAAAYDQGEYYKADWIRGDAFLVHAKVVKEIGVFDERFFMFSEEIDFCVRAARAGYNCAIVKDAKLFRKYGGTLDVSSPLRYYYMVRNALLFIDKNSSEELKKKMQKRYFKSLLWTFYDKHLPNLCKRGAAKHFRILIAMTHGAIDYFRGSFGQLKHAAFYSY